MKNAGLVFLSLIIYQLSITNCNAQSGEWTWIKGDSNTTYAFNAGTITVPSPANEPEARYACGSWTDTAGNFWIYSGTNAFADLWRFDVDSLEWTWMNGDDSAFDLSSYIEAPIGIYNPNNSPGQLGYGMLTWTTPNNHLWLYGGLLNTSGSVQPVINDALWQYDPAINQWAYMGSFGDGPSNLPYWGARGIADTTNKPGGRQQGNCAWTDSAGNLWFFGGADIDVRSYNDIWEYNVGTGIWTWMSGSNKANDTVAYYGAVGQPGVLYDPTARMNNFFWKDNTGNFWLSGGSQYTDSLFFQDTWEFNPQTLEWTWVNGPKGNDLSIFGRECIQDSLDEPGPRFGNSGWRLCNDLVITFAGFNNWNDGILNSNVQTNDMWAYKISANKWIKINSWPDAGDYGQRGVSASSNYPPSRVGAASFTGKDGSLWLFGGLDSAGFFNDLWKYKVDSTCVSCSRSCNLASPIIAMHADTLFSPVAVTYQWYFNNDTITNATGRYYIPKQPGSYSVLITDTGGCRAISDTVDLIVTGVNNLMPNTNVSIYPNPNSTGNWQLSVGNELVGGQMELFDEEGRLVFQSEIREQHSEITATELPAGVYYLRIASNNVSIVRKLVRL